MQKAGSRGTWRSRRRRVDPPVRAKARLRFPTREQRIETALRQRDEPGIDAVTGTVDRGSQPPLELRYRNVRDRLERRGDVSKVLHGGRDVGEDVRRGTRDQLL